MRIPAMVPAALLAAAPFLAAQAPARVQAFRLPNGLAVLLLEDHERPLVRIRLQIPLGPTDTPADRPGLPALLLRVLDRSEAGDLKPEDLDRAVDRAGLDWRQEAGPGGLAWHLVARSRDQDLALGLLADRLLRSLPATADLEVQRLAAWREEEWAGHPPRPRLRRALEPDPALRPPSLEGLGALTAEDLQAFQARVLRPDRAVLLLHGDLGLEQAKRLVLLSLGTWTAGQPRPAAPAAAAPPPGPVLVPAPGAPLRLQALAAAPADLPPEARALLAHLLPADPALRPVRVALEGGRLVLTRDGGAAWDDLLEPLATLRRRGFSEADLRRARAAWASGRALEGLHAETLLDGALLAFQGRAPEPAKVETLSLEALNAALRRWLDPTGLRVGATGDPAALKDLARP